MDRHIWTRFTLFVFTVLESNFVTTLLSWYKKYQRSLPWRGTKDPYKIWLSEITLQQTRTQQALPYYLRLLERFPTLEILAQSSEEELLRYWQGLGYYSRARNMREAARTLFEKHKGNFPRTPNELQKIKGIGPYTAAAIASFAFDYPSPVLDGNVFRLLARYFGIKVDISASSSRPLFINKLDNLIKSQDPSLFNQAIMEFGALQCSPKPRCSSCPLRSGCYAFNYKQVAYLPCKAPRRPLRSRYFHYIVIETPKGLCFRNRQTKDIWKGLYDFFVYEGNEPLSWKKLCEKQPVVRPYELQKQSDWYQHLLTHQRIMACFFHLSLSFEEAKSFSYCHHLFHTPYEDINRLPKPILIANYLKAQKILLF